MPVFGQSGALPLAFTDLTVRKRQYKGLGCTIELTLRTSKNHSVCGVAMFQHATMDLVVGRLSRFDIEVLESLDDADGRRAPWEAGLVISIDHLQRLGLVEQKLGEDGPQCVITDNGRAAIRLSRED
jgi:hypothetical protein